MVLAEFSMYPTDKGESVGQYVAQLLDVIDKSGLTYRLTAMGTILEGSWDEVMGVVTQCFKILESQSHRITVFVKVDYRQGEESRMERKVRRVEDLLHRKLHHT